MTENSGGGGGKNNTTAAAASLDPSIWLKTASALQELQSSLKDDEINLHVPTFVFIGMQSSGKTRMLSTFAKCKLGGAEQKGTGTRCPVVYSFKVDKKLNSLQCWFIGERIEAREIHSLISKHMTVIANKCPNAECKGCPRCFSNYPLTIKICGDLPLHGTVVDLPGLRPRGDPANSVISEMIREYVTKPCTIPIVMSFIPVPVDLTYLEPTLEDIVRCFGDARAQVARRATVLVSHLDCVYRGVEDDFLTRWCAVATRPDIGFDRDNVIFFSLAPEVLGGENRIANDDDASFEDLTKYFAETMLDKEKRYLYAVRQRWSTGFNFGIKTAIERLESILAEAMHENFEIASQEIKKLWLKLDRDCALECPYYSDEHLVRSYVTLLTNMLHGTANANPQLISSGLNEAFSQHPLLVTAGRHAAVTEELIKAIQASFDDEMSRIEVTALHDDFFAHIGDNSKFTNLAPLLTGCLRDRLGSSIAVHRIMSLMGFYQLTRDLKKFDASLIKTLAGGVDLTPDHGTNLVSAIQKMVHLIGAEARESYEFVLKWCASVYQFQVPVVSDILRKYVHLLDRYPPLRDHISRRVQREYERIYERLALQMMAEAEKLLRLRFDVFNRNEILGVIRLLSCVGLTRAMSPNDLQSSSSSGDNEQPQPHSSTMIQNSRALEERRREAAKRFSASNEKEPSQYIGHLFNYFATVSSKAEAFLFAEGEKLELSDLDKQNIDENVTKINEKVHMFARYNFGMFHLEFVKLVDSWLIVEAQSRKLHEAVRERVSQHVSWLFSEEGNAKLQCLRRRGTVELQEMTRMLTKLENFIKAVEILNQCCIERGCSPLEFERAYRRKKEVESEIESITKTIKETEQFELDDFNLPPDVFGYDSTGASSKVNFLEQELLRYKEKLDFMRRVSQPTHQQQLLSSAILDAEKQRLLEENKRLEALLSEKTVELETMNIHRTASECEIARLKRQVQMVRKSNDQQPSAAVEQVKPFPQQGLR